MTEISAEILADSIGPHSKRLTTFRVRVHRFVLAELNTHRVFSRNYRSSRAVPVAKLLREVRDTPAMPITWQANKPGMQGGEDLGVEASYMCHNEWVRAANAAADSAERLMQLGLHKSWANRLLEPFVYVHGIITATEWANFFALRCHPDAQPEIRDLAEKMKALLDENEPKLLQPGEWHLPLVDPEDWLQGNLETVKKVSVARCARTTFVTFDGKRSTVEVDVDLYEKLVVSQPAHSSPAEHQATPDTKSHYETSRIIRDGDKEELLFSEQDWDNPSKHGNLVGWIQLRKTLPNEYVAG